MSVDELVGFTGAFAGCAVMLIIPAFLVYCSRRWASQKSPFAHVFYFRIMFCQMPFLNCSALFLKIPLKVSVLHFEYKLRLSLLWMQGIRQIVSWSVESPEGNLKAGNAQKHPPISIRWPRLGTCDSSVGRVVPLIQYFWGLGAIDFEVVRLVLPSK